MAELTYNPEAPDAPEFNEAELEALAIGEKQAQEESKMLAGKYESAEELEKAYMELQQKLGEREAEADTPVEEETVDERPEMAFIAEASEEYYANGGKLSDETIEKLAQTDSKELIQMYLDNLQGANPLQPQVEDLTEQDVTTIKNTVGGDAEYAALMKWAGESLPEKIVTGFDSMVASGNTEAIQLAVLGLQAQYEAQNGKEGRMLTGKGAVERADVFRSQAEVIQAMSDPRYDKDPAYRQDVFEKLDRSPLQY